MSNNRRLGANILLLAVLFRPDWVLADAFVAPFVGYSFGASEFTITDTDTLQETSLRVAEVGHIGFMAGMTTQEPGNLYFLYSHQDTELGGGDNFNQDRITDLDWDYYHLGGSLLFPQGDFKPYISSSAGLTHMRLDDGFSNETRFSVAVGGGIEYPLLDGLSLFADVRAYATFIDGSQSLFCSGGQCRWFVQSDVMWQGQVNLSILLYFCPNFLRRC